MRTVDKVYDTTSASGGALDTGTLNVAQYDALLVLYVASGGSPTACTASVVEGATAVQIASRTPAASDVLWNWTPSAAGTPAIPAGVPQFVNFTGGAIVAQTVRLVVYGIRSFS